jgi:hypothetical protein
MGRDKEAFNVLQAALELLPDNYYILRILLYTCKGAGRTDLAVAISERIAAVGGLEHPLGVTAFAHALAGDVDKAEKVMADLSAGTKVKTIAGYYVALANALLGHHEQALEWLEGAAEEKIGILTILNTEPLFESLRPYPRFQALLLKLGLTNAPSAGAG